MNKSQAMKFVRKIMRRMNKFQKIPSMFKVISQNKPQSKIFKIIKLIPFQCRIHSNSKKNNKKYYKIKIARFSMLIVVNHSLITFPSMIQMINGYNRINNPSLSPLCHPIVKDRIFLLYFRLQIKIKT